MCDTINVSERVHSVNHLLLKLRDVNTKMVQFKSYADRLMSIIIEEGLSHVSPSEICVESPTGSVVTGPYIDTSDVVVISIIRAADSMLDVFMKIAPDACVGKVLVQRDEETALPILYYSKLPSLVNKKVIVLDPMLATGGSARLAIKILIDKGVEERSIYFFNVVSSPEGIANMKAAYPLLTIVTGFIDEGMNEKRYIIPGLGDFGDRYFGTC